MGFRYESVDYELYSKIFNSQSFENINFPFYSKGDGAKEFLFSSIISTFKGLNLNYGFFIFTFAFVSILIKFYYIKKYSPYFFLSFLIFLVFIFAKEMGQFRNAMISAIILIAIFPLIKRNFFWYLAIVFLSSGIHIFSLIALPIYFIYPFLRNKNVSKVILVIGLAIFLIGGLFSYIYSISNIFGEVIHSKLTYYYTIREFKPLSFNIFNLSLLFFGILFIIFKDMFIKKDSFEEGLYVYFIYSLFLYFVFCDVSTVGVRALNYLAFMPLVILIPLFISKIQIDKLRFFTYLMIVIYCIINFYPTQKSMEKYKNVLFEKDFNSQT